MPTPASPCWQGRYPGGEVGYHRCAVRVVERLHQPNAPRWRCALADTAPGLRSNRPCLKLQFPLVPGHQTGRGRRRPPRRTSANPSRAPSDSRCPGATSFEAVRRRLGPASGIADPAGQPIGRRPGPPKLRMQRSRLPGKVDLGLVVPAGPTGVRDRTTRIPRQTTPTSSTSATRPSKPAVPIPLPASLVDGGRR